MAKQARRLTTARWSRTQSKRFKAVAKKFLKKSHIAIKLPRVLVWGLTVCWRRQMILKRSSTQSIPRIAAIWTATWHISTAESPCINRSYNQSRKKIQKVLRATRRQLCRLAVKCCPEIRRPKELRSKTTRIGVLQPLAFRIPERTLLHKMKKAEPSQI